MKTKVETRKLKHIKISAQLQYQEQELYELRVKVERESNERSLKNTEISNFSEFQSMRVGSVDTNTNGRLSPKAS